MNLAALLQRRSDIWRGADHCPVGQSGVPTGFDLLDQQLAGGWPRGGMVEILSDDQTGFDGLGLVVPSLASLSRQARWIVLVAPPYIPYAPGLAARGVDLSRLLLLHPRGWQEQLWALEQTLRSGVCSAVLGWPGRVNTAVLRRLQLAAEAGRSGGFLFRSAQAAEASSPAALRLRVRSAGGGMEVEILKRRGGWPVAGLRISPN